MNKKVFWKMFGDPLFTDETIENTIISSLIGKVHLYTRQSALFSKIKKKCLKV